jgi:hypothetical protein
LAESTWTALTFQLPERDRLALFENVQVPASAPLRAYAVQDALFTQRPDSDR